VTSQAGADPVTIYLPCEVVEVKVRIKFEESLSPVERTALQIIEKRPCTAHKLAELLGLGDRVTVDLLHDMWRHGYLTFDFTMNIVDLSPEVRTLLQTQGPEALAGSESEEKVLQVMIDKITGQVMPVGSLRNPRSGRLAVDHPRADITLTKAPTADLVTALERQLQQGGDEPDEEQDPSEATAASEPQSDRPCRIVSVRPSEANLRPGDERRWWAVEVRPAIDEDSDALTIAVTDRRFPADRRDKVGARLTQIAAEYPEDPFVVELRSAAGRGLVDPPPLPAAIERLAAAAARTPTVPAGQRITRHRELSDDARQIGGLLDWWAAREVEPEVVSGEAHPAQLIEIIKSARRQVVIVAPWVSYKTIASIEPHLRTATQDGVQVLVLWGLSQRSQLATQPKNTLSSLARLDGPAPLHLPTVSARTHARVVIADDRQALVTGYNVLSPPGQNREVGILLKSTGDYGSEAVRDLLDWARTMVPLGKMARQLYVQAEEFATPGRSPIPSPGGGIEPDRGEPVPAMQVPERKLTLPKPPRRPPDEPADDPRVAKAVRKWTELWLGYAEQLKELLAERTSPVARPVEGIHHRTLLWRALRTAEHRLVIASDRVSHEVIDERFLTALRRCLDRGVPVTIVHNSGADEGIRAALASLAAEYNDLLHLDDSGNHANVLVWDNDAVVGGFNFLSHEGHGAGPRHLHRAELSVRLTGAKIADEIATAAGEPAVVTARVNSTRADVAPERPPAARPRNLAALQAAQRIRNRLLDGRAVAEVIRAELDDTDPWGVLDALGDEVDGVVRTAAAYCLTNYADRAASDVARNWLRRLVRDHWENGDFVAAAVLRHLDPDESTRPRRFLTVLGSCLGRPELASLLLEAADRKDTDGDEDVAILVVAAAELLRSGAEEADLVVAELSPRTKTPWTELGQVVLDYASRARGIPPIDALRAAAIAERNEADIDLAWDRLDQAMARAQGPPVDNNPGKRTHFALFKPTGLLGRLGDAVSRRDIEAIRALSTGLPGVEDIGQFVDETWESVAPRTNPLQGKRRQKYLTRLSDIRTAIDDLKAATAGIARPNPEVTPEESQSAQKLADSLRRILDPSYEAVRRLDPMEQRLAEAGLDEFRKLTDGTWLTRGARRTEGTGQ
jgi:hypothetical protein